MRYKTTHRSPSVRTYTKDLKRAPLQESASVKLEARDMDHAHESLVDLSRRKDAKSLRDHLRLARSDLQDRTRRLFVNYVRRNDSARLYLFDILREVLGSNLIALDYDVNARPRYTPGFPHPLLFDLMNCHRKQYETTLISFLHFRDRFVKISRDAVLGIADTPRWGNGFLPGLDAVTLYSLVAQNSPRRYIEIGSGNSTRFARRAIRDHGLRTQITSVDPTPRDDVDAICDFCLRKPLEDVDLSIFQDLQVGDIVFFDGSHRLLTNSDVAVFFLEVFPLLNPGVLVQIHDIHLPYDYPAEWSNRFYSEQYLLAALILSRTNSFKVLLPNAFISHDEPLTALLRPLWNDPSMKQAEPYGGSFWVTKEPDWEEACA